MKIYVAGAVPTRRSAHICFHREINNFVLSCGHTTCLVCGLEIETQNKNVPSLQGSNSGRKATIYVTTDFLHIVSVNGKFK